MAELNSLAERNAEIATKLPAFRSFNLGGAKDQVAEILNLIGRVDGIFSTYTKHDISHIDAMLKMLEWLIPERTAAAMTPVDWLMVVLGIYLHDLGMVVSSAEYEDRLHNEEFLRFLEWLHNDPDSRDYWARAETMNEEEKNRFFYQEFVRWKHAARIREWVSGKQSRFWGETIKPFSDEINEMMSNLPSRFRENLAIVCESHHKDNLDKIEIYPLAQRYGNDRSEIANVQYAALLLRTVDLIHVTKDRTPSVMYRAIKFSDLKSIEEWDKQIGTFSVHMKSREFNPDDTATHIIEVDADFTEERPFFALTEYLAYADSQIKQTKQWADTSQQTADAKNYGFPWRSIKGNIRVEGNLPRQMRFELDRGRLLNLLVGHTIYNEPTVAIRELLQNAIDAIRFQFYLEQKSASASDDNRPKMGKVIVRWNPSTRELVVQDTGIGMDLNTIENHLLTVGSSFYDTPQFQSENSDFTPISRFGIGILTCFMVSDNIEIVTCRNSKGKRVRMTSVQADYLLKELVSGDLQLHGIEPHGTIVKLIIRPSVDLEKKSILEILQQWVLIPACEVFYQETGKDIKQVGFGDISQAMQHLFYGGNKNEGDTEDPYEILLASPKNDTDDPASYELAFVVKGGVYPERSFVSSQDKVRTAVCIEGIRVDWHLPGFSEGLCALLSVRNNKKFRTTVSRESLEIDDEYQRVANLCAAALFSHVRNEVERISSIEGSPLLRASSGGQWVYHSLSSQARGTVYDTLSELYKGLPIVVVERFGETAENRSLRSLNEIEDLRQFWTLEWRAVDYLGIISRDLGRELNITNFLGTLARDLFDPRIDQVIVDPESFRAELSKSHSVVEVDFSMKHQRTILKWAAVDKREWQKVLQHLTLDDVIRISISSGLDLFQTRRGVKKIPTEAIEAIERVTVAKVTGDVSEVIGVRTRMATVLACNTKIADLWNVLMQVLGKADELSLSSAQWSVLLVGTLIVAQRCSLRKIRRSYVRFDASELLGPWRALESELRNLITTALGNIHVSMDLASIAGDETQWFDASAFWRDWTVQFQ